MKKASKRMLSTVLVVLMVLTSAPLQGFVGLELPDLFTTKASALAKTGQCGDNVLWDFNETTGQLVISGTGPMRDYIWTSY